MGAIEVCRTATLGGHVDQCNNCSHQRISYNSCRSRNCPKCQSQARAQWVEDRQADLLETDYFHVVFTVPDEIATVALQNKAAVYDILFRTTADALRTIALDPQHLGAEIGFFAVLHTWGQNLSHHPHLHCVIPGGGISPDGQRWIPCRPGFFLPVRVLSRLFRRLFLEAMEKAHLAGKLSFFNALQALSDHAAFKRHMLLARKAEWVVYAKPPFGGPRQVLDYVGRYTHRIALSNDRIISIEDAKVCFRWRDYRNGNRVGAMTLGADEFIRRFLLHVLPDGFKRIRYYGFLSNRYREQKLAACRQLLSAPEEPTSELKTAQDTPKADRERANATRGDAPTICPVCRHGQMIFLEALPKPQRHGCFHDTS